MNRRRGARLIPAAQRTAVVVSSSGGEHRTGDVIGGHAILAVGVDVKGRTVRLHNSWGVGWGVRGDAWISYRDLEALLQRQGEACVALREVL